jgi:SAM-dependent methyltransferase
MTDWDKRYREGEHTNDEPHPLVTEFASKWPPGRALDIACGAGRHALWLAEHGWKVTAVDSSSAAIDILQKRAADRGVPVHSVRGDLESHEFVIEPAAYDLIVVVNYLQRDLFPSIRGGVRPGGAVIAVIAMIDDDPNIRPMNPKYLLSPGELRAQFKGWKLIHEFEGKPSGDPTRRATSEIVAVLGDGV